MSYLFIVQLLPIAILDMKERRIPNRNVLIAIFVWFLLQATTLIQKVLKIKTSVILELDNPIYAITNFLLFFFVFLAIHILTQGGIGMGDVKLFSIIALYYDQIHSFLIILLSLSFILIFVLIRKTLKKSSVRQSLPAAPYVLLSCLLLLLL